MLARDYIATFKVLPLYDIETLYVCAASLQARGLSENTPFVLDAAVVAPEVLREHLSCFDTILTF